MADADRPAPFEQKSSLPVGRRKGKRKGFTQPKGERKNGAEYNLDAIEMSASIVVTLARKLSKLKNDINRKSKKTASRTLKMVKDNYGKYLSEMLEELKKLKEIAPEREENDPRTNGLEKPSCVSEDEPNATGHEQSAERCVQCFHHEKEMFKLYAEIDSLIRQLDEEKKDRTEAVASIRQQLYEERKTKEEALISIRQQLYEETKAKEEALIRLSALASRLVDSPNLDDLSDPNRPSKIAEMFSDLYDNHWTDAYDELTISEAEVDAIRDLNSLVMIDSELRQTMIAHMKRNAMVVLQELYKEK